MPPAPGCVATPGTFTARGPLRCRCSIAAGLWRAPGPAAEQLGTPGCWRRPGPLPSLRAARWSPAHPAPCQMVPYLSCSLGSANDPCSPPVEGLLSATASLRGCEELPPARLSGQPGAFGAAGRGLSLRRGTSPGSPQMLTRSRGWGAVASPRAQQAPRVRVGCQPPSPAPLQPRWPRCGMLRSVCASAAEPGAARSGRALGAGLGSAAGPAPGLLRAGGSRAPR